MVVSLARYFKVLLFFILALGAFEVLHAQSLTLPNVNLGFKSVNDPKEVVSAIKLIVILTVLTLAPAILIMMTSFTRIVIVLSFIRQALGTQQMPPNQLLMGLALFLTFFVMAPAFEKINVEAIQPYLSGKMSQEVAMEKGVKPLRKFMFNQTRDTDLSRRRA